MCDTLVITPEASADGRMLFAKNSDRERDEAQQVVCVPRRAHPRSAALQTTRIEIPQVARTRAVLLARPWWMWGAEMGSNDAGVTIGNEALFTRRAGGDDALLGMDLLRLGLERAGTAVEALEVMTGLLEAHGQGGNCAVHRRFEYDNGFLIADPREAWVLETCGRHWVARRVEGMDAISNIASTTTAFDRASDGAFDALRASGWLAPDAPDDFSRAITDPERSAPGNGAGRCSRSKELLAALGRPATPRELMAILRDHGPDPAWRPDDLTRPSTLCMHAGGGEVRQSQTTGSMVSVLDPQGATHFLTGTAAPCTSLFRPAWIGAAPTAFRRLPERQADDASLFWRHERRHRLALRDLPAALARIAAERDAFEAHWVQAALEAAGAPLDRRQALADQASRAAEAVLEGWDEVLAGLPARGDLDPDWLATWAAIDRRSGLA